MTGSTPQQIISGPAQPGSITVRDAVID
ncbi:MAG: hypothetical protein QOD67_4949, partial [Caballeronia sp.]|nr:hypothetical protein [Caballeronia sp.]